MSTFPRFNPSIADPFEEINEQTRIHGTADLAASLAEIGWHRSAEYAAIKCSEALIQDALQQLSTPETAALVRHLSEAITQLMLTTQDAVTHGGRLGYALGIHREEIDRGGWFAWQQAAEDHLARLGCRDHAWFATDRWTDAIRTDLRALAAASEGAQQ